MLDLADKDFKVAIRNMCKELKTIVPKKRKESRIHQIQNSSKYIEITKKNQMDIQKLNYTKTELKN